MIARFEQRRDGADGGHARREREPGRAALDVGDVSLERLAGRVLRTCVLVALVFPELFLYVGGRLINRRDDRAGRRVGLLAGVQTTRAESRVFWELHDPLTIHALASAVTRLTQHAKLCLA